MKSSEVKLNLDLTLGYTEQSNGNERIEQVTKAIQPQIMKKLVCQEGFLNLFGGGSFKTQFK